VTVGMLLLAGPQQRAGQTFPWCPWGVLWVLGVRGAHEWSGWSMLHCRSSRSRTVSLKVHATAPPYRNTCVLL